MPGRGTASREDGHDIARRALIWIGTAAAVVLLLGIAWRAFEVVLVVFGGALIALVLGTLAGWVGRVTHLRHGFNLAMTVIGLLVIIAACTWLLSARLVVQVQELAIRLPTALDTLEATLATSKLGALILRYLGEAQSTLAKPSTVVPVAKDVSRGVAALVVTLFLGLFIAIDPDLYERGLAALVPPGARPRARAVLEAMGERLRWWMVAQVVLMIALGSAAAVGLWLVGMPIPMALGAMTGLFIFVPYVGSIAAFLVTVAIALAESTQLAIAVAIVYIAIHLLEGYVLAPLLHWDIVSLPPGLTIAAQTLAFVLLGIPGVLLATPLTAAGIVLVNALYVDELLTETEIVTDQRLRPAPPPRAASSDR